MNGKLKNKVNKDIGKTPMSLFCQQDLSVLVIIFLVLFVLLILFVVLVIFIVLVVSVVIVVLIVSVVIHCFHLLMSEPLNPLVQIPL